MQPNCMINYFQYLISIYDNHSRAFCYSDTCVDDADCKDIPHTVCRNIPVNEGLDPGTRGAAFEFWEPRDTLLKSCFCKVKKTWSS